MRKITRIHEFNKSKLHLMREPQRGAGLIDILTKMYQIYKVAAPVVKGVNALYRSKLVQKNIIPKSVKKHLNPISSTLSNITETTDALHAVSAVGKYMTGGSMESHLIEVGDLKNASKIVENPASDLLKLVSKKAKSMKSDSLKQTGKGLHTVGHTPCIKKACCSSKQKGSGLTEDILKKIIAVIATEMIEVIIVQVNKKLQLSDAKSKALKEFLTKKLDQMLKQDLPSLPSALLSMGKMLVSPIKHMFGGGGPEYKKQKHKVMKKIHHRANELVLLYK